MALAASTSEHKAGHASKEVDPDMCGVCLETLYSSDSALTRLPRCGHQFHRRCLPAMNWPGGDGETWLCIICSDLVRRSEMTPIDNSRVMLLKAVFLACDVDCDGRLGSAELRSFAAHTGFDGNDVDWENEYSALCEERFCDPAVGLNLCTFEEFVNDESETGCQCTDVELRSFLSKTKKGIT
jgi:hypothetical protein